jgi:hypothetical protein
MSDLVVRTITFFLATAMILWAVAYVTDLWGFARFARQFQSTWWWVLIWFGFAMWNLWCIWFLRRRANSRRT